MVNVCAKITHRVHPSPSRSLVLARRLSCQRQYNREDPVLHVFNPRQKAVADNERLGDSQYIYLQGRMSGRLLPHHL